MNTVSERIWKKAVTVQFETLKLHSSGQIEAHRVDIRCGGWEWKRSSLECKSQTLPLTPTRLVRWIFNVWVATVRNKLAFLNTSINLLAPETARNSVIRWTTVDLSRMILHRRVSRLGILWIICVIAYCFIMVLLSFRVYLLDSLSSSLNEWLLSCLINGGIYFSIYNLVVLQNELYVRETVHHQYNDVNNQQDATTFSFINLIIQPYMFRASHLNRATGRQQYRCIVPKAVYTVKKCSWGWANLSFETRRADLKRLIKKKLLHLFGCLHCSFGTLIIRYDCPYNRQMERHFTLLHTTNIITLLPVNDVI
jgi:hypothetical protein